MGRPSPKTDDFRPQRATSTEWHAAQDLQDFTLLGDDNMNRIIEHSHP